MYLNYLLFMLVITACTFDVASTNSAIHNNNDPDSRLRNGGDKLWNLKGTAAPRAAEGGLMGQETEERSASSLFTKAKSLFQKSPGVTKVTAEQHSALMKMLRKNPSFKKDIETMQNNPAFMKSLEQNPVATKLKATLQNKPAKLTPKNIENVGRAVAKTSFKIPDVSSDTLLTIFFILGVTVLVPAFTIYASRQPAAT